VSRGNRLVAWGFEAVGRFLVLWFPHSRANYWRHEAAYGRTNLAAASFVTVLELKRPCVTHGAFCFEMSLSVITRFRDLDTKSLKD
jgi:hypothetical protein